MTARQIAFDVLTRWKPRAPHASQLLDTLFSREKIAGAERALAMELVHGVMRRRETLSALLKPHINRPLNQVEQGALTLLWLGAYQLVMLSGIPAYAVVNETAELAKRAGKPQWTGFINAVLRSLGGNVTDEFVNGEFVNGEFVNGEFVNGDFVTAHAMNAVPLASTAEHAIRFRVITNDVFVDPEEDWPGYFAAAFSFPPWLVARWQKRYERAELTRLGFLVQFSIETLPARQSAANDPRKVSRSTRKRRRRGTDRATCRVGLARRNCIRAALTGLR